MAITNQERAGKAMDLLRAGLAPFVEREIQSAVKTGSVRMDCKGGGIDRDESSLPSLQELKMGADASRLEEGIHFDGLERVDRSLRDGHRLIPAEEEVAYRTGLERLANIRSGKKGSTMPRHVLEALDGKI